MVWETTNKPNYGMRNLDGILEERACNKLELTGPLIDGYLRELGKSMTDKLGRSRHTGLMAHQINADDCSNNITFIHQLLDI